VFHTSSYTFKNHSTVSVLQLSVSISSTHPFASETDPTAPLQLPHIRSASLAGHQRLESSRKHLVSNQHRRAPPARLATSHLSNIIKHHARVNSGIETFKAPSSKLVLKSTRSTPAAGYITARPCPPSRNNSSTELLPDLQHIKAACEHSKNCTRCRPNHSSRPQMVYLSLSPYLPSSTNNVITKARG
jgi:hypothetical protein